MNRRVLIIGIAVGVVLLVIGGIVVFFIQSSNNASSVPSPTPPPGSIPLATSNPNTSPLASPSDNPVAFRGVCPDTWAGQQDSDRDGLPDSIEATYGTDPQSVDTDGDGYQDGEEVRAGYDPLNKDSTARLDSDKDGLLDNEECIWRTDPFNPDSDGDGFSDGAEVANGFDPAKKGDGNGSDRMVTPTPDPLATPPLEPSKPTPTPLPFSGSTGSGAFVPTPAPTLKPIGNSTTVTQLPLIPITQLRITSSTSKADVQEYLAQIDALRPAELSDGQAITNAIQSAATGNTQPLAEVRSRISQFASALKGVSTPKNAGEYHQLYVSLIDFTAQQVQIIEQNATGDQQKAVQAVLNLQNILPTQLTKLSQLRLSLESVVNQ